MTEQLVDLQSVTRLSPSVVRILGANPGKFTLQGTNTYLISGEEQSSQSSLSCILIDTGEGMEAYIASLKKVLQGQDSRVGSTKRTISDIILTHRHHDHVGGLPSVLHLLSELQSHPPRIHKYPDAATDEALHTQLKQLPLKLYQPHQAFDGHVPIKPLKDGDEISAGDDHSSGLQVVHSPGHTADHICLFFPKEGALFTGDHVLGQGTSVFEDLGSYLRSLQKCWKVLQDVSPDKERLLYPAHGPTIENGKKALKNYLNHRIERENQILELLATKPDSESGNSGGQDEVAGGGWTIKAIVSKLYSDYPEHLYPAAARGIFLHLQKLALPDEEAVERGVVGREHQGRRVQCVGTGAGKSGLAPIIPNGDTEWVRAMDLQWRLLDQMSDIESSKENDKEGMDIDQKGSL